MCVGFLACVAAKAQESSTPAHEPAPGVPLPAKEKGAALAWGLLPGGSVFYSGRDNALGAMFAFVEALSIGTVVYSNHDVARGIDPAMDRKMITIYSIVLVAAKVGEIIRGIDLVNDYNRDLMERAHEPGTRPGNISAVPAGPQNICLLHFSFNL